MLNNTALNGLPFQTKNQNSTGSGLEPATAATASQIHTTPPSLTTTTTTVPGAPLRRLARTTTTTDLNTPYRPPREASPYERPVPIISDDFPQVNPNGGPARANRRDRAGQRLTRFVFTLPNWTQKEYENITLSPAKWLIMGKEICPKTQTPHLQGACIIGKQLAFMTVKKWPGFERCHIEPMKGSVSDQVKYCTKEDSNAFEMGTRPLESGKKTSLSSAVQRVMEGATLAQIATDEQGGEAIVKFHKGLTVLRSVLVKARTHPPTVVWISGATGSGKTRESIRLSDRLFGVSNYWISSGGLRWFDGYDGQPCAIFDDFRTKHVSHFSFLLRLLDRYPVQVEIKGAYVQWVPRLIIITTCHNPRDTWSYSTSENIAQLERRITHTIELPEEMELLSELSLVSNTPLQVPVLPGEDGENSINHQRSERSPRRISSTGSLPSTPPTIPNTPENERGRSRSHSRSNGRRDVPGLAGIGQNNSRGSSIVERSISPYSANLREQLRRGATTTPRMVIDLSGRGEGSGEGSELSISCASEEENLL